MKKALVIRLGALGDAVMITPLLRLLKEDGYHVTVNCKKYSENVLRHNPYIDKFLLHDESIPNEKLDEHWAAIGTGYDRIINLSESIERGLLAVEGRPEFVLPHEERHSLYNHNYYDRTLEIGGYKERGLNGELYFSPAEETWFADFRKKLIGKYKVLWSLSGSSHHKVYPYAEYVGRAFLNKHPDAVIITVGDDVCKLLEWDHPRTIKKSGEWPIRKSFLMTKYADLVVSSESAIANAAGCFDVPKIIFLSHSSEENLTKYWKNCTTLTGQVPCHPCHQIHYTEESCPCDGSVVKGPVCMSELMPGTVMEAMEKEYQKWRMVGFDTRSQQLGISA